MEFEADVELEVDPQTNDDGNTGDFEFEDNIDDEDLIYEIPKASKVILYHGQSLSDGDWLRSGFKTKPISVHYYDLSHSLREPYKYMSAKVIESNEALNEYLDGFVFEVKARCRDLSETQLENEEFRNIVNDLADEETLTTRLNVKTAAETYYIGRIRYGYTQNRLNSRNLFLESSLSYCHGDVVPLDISRFKEQNSSQSTDKDPSSQGSHLMSLFPGQIVVIKAQNPTGSCIHVTQFIELSDILQASFPPKCPPALLENEQTSIVCACGPFVSFDTSSPIDLTDTTYMKALADYTKRYYPDVLFIFGPFLDEAHADAIAKWALRDSESSNISYNWTVEKLFNHQFRAFCKELEGLNLQTQVIFIPSPNEFGSANIFPTYPTNIKQLLPIQSFSNPSLLNLGGISVGVTATDILLHMSRHEISNFTKDDASNKKSDRLKRLCAHILEHRNFYPLLPPDRSVNLECSMYNYLSMPITPHLLIVPSILRPFIYNVDNTIAINPGKVTKNSIARILIDPMKDAASYTGSISQYVNVEITKLIVK